MRRLDLENARQMRRHADDEQLGIDQARKKMLNKRSKEIQRRRGTIAEPMSKSMVGAICPICSLEYEPGDKVEVLGCHKTHMIHTECMNQVKKFAFQKKAPLTCPICRKTVDGTKIVKKKLMEVDAHVEVYDPFAVEVLAPNPPKLD